MRPHASLNNGPRFGHIRPPKSAEIGRYGPALGEHRPAFELFARPTGAPDNTSQVGPGRRQAPRPSPSLPSMGDACLAPPAESFSAHPVLRGVAGQVSHGLIQPWRGAASGGLLADATSGCIDSQGAVFPGSACVCFGPRQVGPRIVAAVSSPLRCQMEMPCRAPPRWAFQKPAPSNTQLLCGKHRTLFVVLHNMEKGSKHPPDRRNIFEWLSNFRRMHRIIDEVSSS